MTSFTDLISKWHALMRFDAETQKLAASGITMLDEKRIESITADYIASLVSIQEQADSASEAFANRVLENNSVSGFERELAIQVCERFLTSIGLVFRNQIPRSVSRKDRLAARTFEIHWDFGNDVAQWPELGESFPLENAIRLCADHFGGANQELENAITSQFLTDLHAGLLEIPRLKLESNSETVSVFTWEDANAPMGDHPDSGEESEHESSPILTAFRDDRDFLKRRLIAEMQETEIADDIYSNTQYEIDRTELTANDEVYISVRDLVKETEDSSELSRIQILSAISSTACMSVSASIPRKDRSLTTHRAKVVKSLNRLKFEENSKEDQMELV